MITITAFKWVPPFAQGQVRDHRLRWMLRELGWPYQVRLIDAVEQRTPAYRALQPFGQVPALEEPGRPPMFETGAIVLDLAERAGVLTGEPDQRGQVLCWYFAALNSVEPFQQALAQLEFFEKDEAVQAQQRPGARKLAERRLAEVQAALGHRDWLVGGSFTIADLMMSSVTKISSSLGLMEAFPTLSAWQARCFDRPAYRAAIAEQMADFAGHGPADMRWTK